MERTIDLNLDNYGLDDLLALFQLTPDFGETELKVSRRTVMKMHPDKSGLDKEYFIFFGRAFNLLVNVMRFRAKSETNYVATSDMVSVDMPQGDKELLRRVENTKGFHKWFNDMFEKDGAYLREGGHGDWFTSDEDLDSRETTRADMAAAFETKKEEMRAIVKHRGIGEMASGTACAPGALGESLEDYGNEDIFSRMPYEDLKRAHTETVVPVTSEDYHAKDKYTFSQMQDVRSSQNTTPMTQEESIRHLQSKEADETGIASRRAFELAKQDEIGRKFTQRWWGGIRNIRDG
jgi:hypothetical protein